MHFRIKVIKLIDTGQNGHLSINMVPFLSHLEQVKIFYSIWQGRPVCFMRKLLNFKGSMQVTHILDTHRDIKRSIFELFARS